MLNGWNAKHTLAAVAMVLVFVLILVFAFDVGRGDDDTPEATSTPTAGSMPTVPPTSAPPENAPLVVAPGKVGAAEAGMTKAQAAATGLFNTDVDHGPDDCRGVTPLEWKSSVSTSLDVLTEEDDSIAAIGVTEGGPKTAEGIGVGSTFGSLSTAYGGLSPVVDAGFDQSGAFINEGDAWLGFLFDEKPGAITEGSRIVFMEVDDQKPELIRDGC